MASTIIFIAKLFIIILGLLTLMFVVLKLFVNGDDNDDFNF